MSVIKGIFNFVIMLILSVCMMLFMGYKIMDQSIMSLEENQTLLETTSFSEEVANEMLETYHMSLSELNFEKETIIKFVNDSAVGVLGYVFLENDTMPTVDVTFLKDYVKDEIAEQSQHLLQGNVDLSPMITALRAVPEGTSVSNEIDKYINDSGFDINQSEIDMITETYIENKDLEDDALLQKLVSSIAYEKLNVDTMNTELSLQQLFDKLMKKNPFTILRNLKETADKNVSGYLLITIVLLVLLLITTEFRVGATSVWIALALIVSIIPLQLIRLADLFLNYEILDIFSGLESYKNYMMDNIISELNMMTIVVVISIIVLFILSRVFRSKVDTKIENATNGRSKLVMLTRFVAFLVLLLALYLNVNAGKNFNLETYNNLKEIQASDFDPQSVDLILREELNIDFDF